MQITHEQARKLIQFDMDQGLKPDEEKLLQTHLDDCIECHSFAEEMQEVDSILLPVMNKHWKLEPQPLPIASIVENINSNRQTRMLVTIRMALISIVFVAFVLSAWQFTRSQNSSPIPVNVLPIPTPSGQSTSTKIRPTNCEEMLYQVQENDTLARIALRFSVSKDQMMAINNMNEETVRAKMVLRIPVCKSTPTETRHPSTLTRTFTPLIDQTTSTPGG